MKIISTLFAVVSLALLSMSFISFGKKNPLKLPKIFLENFSEIPMDKESAEGSASVSGSFYLSTHEVSNLEYREFLHYVKMSGDIQLLNKANIDSSGWRLSNAYCEPYVIHYHAHPAYDNFPVVNVSHEAALAYCDWLTAFNSEQFATLNLKVRYTLPDKEFWKKAADGGHTNPVYAWGGCYLENAKGCKLANFNTLGAEHIYFNQESGKYEVLQPGSDKFVYQFSMQDYDLTAPVNSYSPNDFGLYNMNGNVAEMIDTPGIALGGSWRSPGYDIRNESTEPYDKPSPTVGFRVMAIVTIDN